MKPTLHNAVLFLYSNAVTVRGNDIDSLIAEDINGDAIEIVAKNVTSQLKTLESQYEADQKAQETAKTSALSKLTALGLTQDEIHALIG